MAKRNHWLYVGIVVVVTSPLHRRPVMLSLLLAQLLSMPSPIGVRSGSLSDKVDLEQCDLAGETEPTMERLSKVAGCSNHGQGQGTRRVGRH